MTDLLPAAVLWDMDGTLVDTEPYWMQAEIELVASFGGIWTAQDGLTLVGSGLWHSAGVLQERGVALELDEIVTRLTDRVLEQIAVRVPWRPGALELLAELKNAGIPTALVTMSIRRMAEHVAAAAPAGTFDGIIAGDEVSHSKPHPEPYLRGAQLLNVAADDCVAIEDSRPGLESAAAAGAVCIGVPLHVSLPEHVSYTVWDTLDGKTLVDLANVFQSARTLESGVR
ncbi:HAD family hydrolase [Parafrigoribacterium mesophilum]|uniref:HAD family hydrolase n=1 Tax=Parafrigoribacterium mesophilum TaxID=433646 RepID=UPI0031FD0216